MASYALVFLLASVSSVLGTTTPTPTPTNSNEHTHHVHVNNDNEHHKHLYNQHHQHQHHSTNSRVLELSDRFLDLVNQAAPSVGNGVAPEEPKFQPWLVMFYAPWCGHCKRLEPVFNHVAQALHNTPIRVGRVDCTRFPSVGSEFKIPGYPTIMFIAGPTRKHTFQGDRELSQIVRFAKRMASPPVTISGMSVSSFIPSHTMKQIEIHEHNPARIKRESDVKPDHDLFFGLVRKPGTANELTAAYQVVASKYQQYNEFFEFNEVDVEEPTVFVYKNNRNVLFADSDKEVVQKNITSMLEHWVGNERFPDFIHFTRGNLHQVFSERGERLQPSACSLWSRRISSNASWPRSRGVNSGGSAFEELQLAVVDPVNNITSPYPLRLDRIARPCKLDRSGAPATANASDNRGVSEQNHKYYVFNNRESIDSESKIQNLVELVKEGHFQATVHADSVSFKLYRYVFDAKVSLTDMWAGNPVLTIVLFGLPLGFLSLILYSACCGDIMDAKEEDESKRARRRSNPMRNANSFFYSYFF
ncbi:Protein disulfide-isomerase TMX3 [Orchesella cincta]|uniref:Protein disulfide-isomerase TMX3 n=1 Tax=Orchesella cincta TaxID=48709 RepID=A0A1D2MQA1_ORCCI|nr:Protein disulfide-isomerase TMX3 [Orchesella cincta]